MKPRLSSGKIHQSDSSSGGSSMAATTVTGTAAFGGFSAGPSIPSCPPDIDFHEAINDSPRFRGQVHLHQLYFQRLESRLQEILKCLMTMQEFGKNYASMFYKLSVAVNQLCDESFSGNALAQSTFGALSDAYARTVHLMRTFHEESTSIVYNKMQNFIKNELAKVATTRVHFDSMAGTADEALAKNAGCSRNKTQEATESRNHLMSVGACFAHTSLDYVEAIYNAHASKDHAVIDALWAFVKESGAFFSRGHAFFDEWTAIDNGGIADTVKALEHKRGYTERQMQDIHSLVPTEMYQHPPGISPDPDVVMEGYLYKRSSNAFKTWNRRWFQIKDNKFLYMHRSGDDNTMPTVMEDNLMLCLVRPAPASVDRIGCFELVTPTRSHLLQADSESLCNAWMRALQRTILHLHESDHKPHRPTVSSTCSSSPSSSTAATPSTSATSNPVETSPPRSSTAAAPSTPSRKSEESFYAQVRAVNGNSRCADCGQPDPKWVSINLGITLCIECCGIHRSLGVQVSKVRSLTMDSLGEEVLDVLVQLGNDRVNGVFLAALPERDVVPPPANEHSTRAVREAWIKAKYVEGRFTARALNRAVQRKASIGVNRSASSADVASLEKASCSRHHNEANEETHSDEGDEVHWRENPLYSPDAAIAARQARLLSAASSGDILSMLSILASGVDVNCAVDGMSALHAAVKSGQPTAVEFLLMNGAKINPANASGDTALHLAAREGHTLLVCQLLKRAADKSAVNIRGETPLDVAVEGKHADIVTLFRVHTMRDEFNEEFDNPMNQTVDDVIHDITRRAARATRTQRVNGVSNGNDASCSVPVVEPTASDDKAT